MTTEMIDVLYYYFDEHSARTKEWEAKAIEAEEAVDARLKGFIKSEKLSRDETDELSHLAGLYGAEEHLAGFRMGVMAGIKLLQEVGLTSGC